MDELTWGIIGCGSVTEVKSGPAFRLPGRSRVAAVMRRNAELAEDYARRHGVPKWYSDAEALIADPGVNAIYIATPPLFHHPYTLAAAKAGKPVYVEKPMSLSHAQSREMIAACERAGVPLFVAYYRRALPVFRQVQSLLESEAIGRVDHVETRLWRKFSAASAGRDWRWDPAIGGGGHFADLGSHMIDLMQFYFGAVVETEGGVLRRNAARGTEEAVEAILFIESGTKVMVDWRFDSDEEIEETRFLGEKGEIAFPIFGDGRLRVDRGRGFVESFHPHPPHVQQPLIESMVGELQGTGRCPSSAASACRTDWALDRLLKRT